MSLSGIQTFNRSCKFGLLGGEHNFMTRILYFHPVIIRIGIGNYISFPYFTKPFIFMSIMPLPESNNTFQTFSSKQLFGVCWLGRVRYKLQNIIFPVYFPGDFGSQNFCVLSHIISSEKVFVLSITVTPATSRYNVILRINENKESLWLRINGFLNTLKFSSDYLTLVSDEQLII